MSEPKLNIKEETSAKKTRSPPKKAKVEQTVPKKKKLKTDADKAAEKAQHLRFGKAELTPDELSRLSKAQKREMYAAHAARSAVHREVDQYEDENVGVQALSEGEKAAETTHDIAKSRYARKLKKKAKMQGKKSTKTAKSSAQKPTSAQDAGASGTGEGGSNWLSRWKQRQEMRDLNLLNQAWPNAVFGLRPRLFFLLIPYIYIFVLHRRFYERERPYHLRASDLRGNGTDPGDDSVHPHALRCLPL